MTVRVEAAAARTVCHPLWTSLWREKSSCDSKTLIDQTAKQNNMHTCPIVQMSSIHRCEKRLWLLQTGRAKRLTGMAAADGTLVQFCHRLPVSWICIDPLLMIRSGHHLVIVQLYSFDTLYYKWCVLYATFVSCALVVYSWCFHSANETVILDRVYCFCNINQHFSLRYLSHRLKESFAVQH